MADHLLSHVFDTNSTRDLGRRICQEDWERIRNKWKSRKFTTAWVPLVIGELLGTNLIEGDNPTESACIQIAQAVRRFDVLAERDVLPGPKDLDKWAFGRFAGGTSPFPPNREESEHRDLLEIAKMLSTPDLIEVMHLGEGGAHVKLTHPVTGEVIGQTIPAGFADYTKERSERIAELLATDGLLRDDLTDQEIVKFIMDHIHHMVFSLGKQLGLADSIVKATLDGGRMKEMLNTVFTCKAALVNWYLIERASMRKTRAIREAAGRDLMIAGYIPLGQRFVTSDAELLKLLKKLFDQKHLMTFDDFLDDMGIPDRAK